MSAGCPVRCTGTIAFVRGVIAASRRSEFRFMSSRRTSTNRGVAPSSAAEDAEAMNEFGAVITSSPGPIPSERSTRISADVPSATPTA